MWAQRGRIEWLTKTWERWGPDDPCWGTLAGSLATGRVGWGGIAGGAGLGRAWWKRDPPKFCTRGQGNEGNRVTMCKSSIANIRWQKFKSAWTRSIRNTWGKWAATASATIDETDPDKSLRRLHLRLERWHHVHKHRQRRVGGWLGQQRQGRRPKSRLRWRLRSRIRGGSWSGLLVGWQLVVETRPRWAPILIAPIFARRGRWGGRPAGRQQTLLGRRPGWRGQWKNRLVGGEQCGVCPQQHSHVGGGIQHYIVLLPAVHQSLVPLDPGLMGKWGRQLILSHVGQKRLARRARGWIIQPPRCDAEGTVGARVPQVLCRCAGVIPCGMTTLEGSISAIILEIDREASISIKRIKVTCLPIFG